MTVMKRRVLTPSSGSYTDDRWLFEVLVLALETDFDFQILSMRPEILLLPGLSTEEVLKNAALERDDL